MSNRNSDRIMVCSVTREALSVVREA